MASKIRKGLHIVRKDIHVLSRKGELFRSVTYVSVHKRGFFTVILKIGLFVIFL